MPSGLHLVGDDEEAGEEDDTDPVERLRALIDQRRSESVAILKSWMEDEEPV